MRNPREPEPSVVWHTLAELSVPVAEFNLALSKLHPVISWIPEMSCTALLQNWTRNEPTYGEAGLRKIRFPLQRGYAHLPLQLSERIFQKVFAMLRTHTPETASSVLVCTSSFWARTAALWQGPVVYYATDRTSAYSGLSYRSVLAADRRMCDIADLVCPNSRRLADYLEQEAGCASDKILVLPNATRAANVLSAPFDRRGKLPADVPGISRRTVGVIGNMGDNMDWELVHAAMEDVPEFTWLFVGPLPRAMLSRRGYRARAKVIRSSRAVFLGARPYGELWQYARAVVMPYSRIEPTFSGSSTRFYEHLAAGRPMLATRGVEELLHKEPLLTLVDSSEELSQQLRRFVVDASDHREAMRCFASRSETWEARALAMRTALFPLLARDTETETLRIAETVSDAAVPM